MTENTTLCYIEKDNQYLMLHRIKKDHDVNKDKWIGIGGHIEEEESPDECIIREALEETGLTLHSVEFRGVITFVANPWPAEQIFLFICKDFSGELLECNEGQLEWVDKAAVYELPIWEGDKIFFKLLEEERAPFFLKLHYDGDKLDEAILDGKKIC